MGRPSFPQFTDEKDLLYKLRTLVDELSRWIEEQELGGGGGSSTAGGDETFVTITDETGTLANSRQLVAGLSTTVNSATPGEVAIDARAYPPQLGYAGII